VRILKPKRHRDFVHKIISRTNSRWRAISWFFFCVSWGRKNDSAAAAKEEEQEEQEGAGTMALYACLIAAEDFRAAAVAVSCAHRCGGKKCQSCD
jgi:hypothetical protein